MTTMRSIACAAALTALAGTARAQTTAIAYEVSTDYANWSREIQASPGATLYVRARIRLDGATTLGLQYATFGASLSNWRDADGDQILPFTSWTNGVEYAPLNTGRLLPLADPRALALGTTADPAGVMRIGLYAGAGAKPQVMTYRQGPRQSLGTDFDPDPSPLLFVYALTLSESWVEPRDLVASSYRTSTTSVSWNTGWYQSDSGTDSLLTSEVVHDFGTIHVIPAPGGAIAFLLIGSAAGRRRRRGG